MSRLVIAGLLIAACSSSTPSTKGTNGSGSSTVQKDAAMSQDTAPIYPADQLLAWLEEHKDQVLRLPVLVTLKPNRMNVKSATVGDQPDALAIKAADNTMAVPLAGKWGQYCGSGETCMLLLEGVWAGGEAKQFQVREVVKAIPDNEIATATTAALAK